MPDELAISEDFERYDDADELRRLIRTVKFAQKHFLYFVCCNQVPKQNELIAAVEKEFKGKKIRVVKFKKPVTDLLGELQKKNIAHDCEAVFVQGLEWSISSDGKGAENALIYNLNISRDSFKRYLSCPLFLWLPEYAIVKITRHAPDFFSVRSGTFYFSNPPEQVAEQIFQSISSSFTESSSLPIAEKLNQIKSLEGLLVEYRVLHSEKRDNHIEVRLLSKLSNFYYSISKFKKAIEYLKEGLNISRKIENRLEEGNILNNLGTVYLSLGKYHKCIDYFEQSLNISREISDQHGEAVSLGSLGVVYKELGEYSKAIEYQQSALAISNKLENKLSQGNILNNLGVLYDILGEHKKALMFFKQSITIFQNIGDRQGEGKSLGNLSGTYKILGDHRKAIENGKIVLKIFREIGDKLSEAISIDNLGGSYYDLGESEKACNLWKEALIIYEAIESPKATQVKLLLEKNCENQSVIDI